MFNTHEELVSAVKKGELVNQSQIKYNIWDYESHSKYFTNYIVVYLKGNIVVVVYADNPCLITAIGSLSDLGEILVNLDNQ